MTNEPWHRAAVGGLWDVMGTLQLEFLRKQGLRPEHQFLDIGCGSLRAGVHLVPYLDPGHYCGIDADPKLLEHGREELATLSLLDRDVRLVCDSEFNFDLFERRFDFAIAQSLFTHLPLNRVMRCLLRVQEVLRPAGVMYATFFENLLGTRRLDVIEHPSKIGESIVTTPDADPFHYGFDAFEWLCEGTDLEPALIGDWAHPRGQRMMAFTKKNPTHGGLD